MADEYWVSGITRYPVLAPQGQVIATVTLAPVDSSGQRSKIELNVMTEAELRQYPEGRHYLVDIAPKPA